MKTHALTAAAAMLVLALSGQAARSDCDDVMKNLEDTNKIASKVVELDMADITKKNPQTDDERASLKNRFCSVSGEFLGVTSVHRAVAAECLKGSERRNTLASLDEAIKKLQDSLDQACK